MQAKKNRRYFSKAHRIRCCFSISIVFIHLPLNCFAFTESLCAFYRHCWCRLFWFGGSTMWCHIDPFTMRYANLHLRSFLDWNIKFHHNDFIFQCYCLLCGRKVLKTDGFECDAIDYGVLGLLHKLNHCKNTKLLNVELNEMSRFECAKFTMEFQEPKKNHCHLQCMRFSK